MPDAYKGDSNELYPARRSVAGFYLLQLFELPYLIKVCQPEALFYANGAGLLVFSSFMLVMVQRYFFLQTPSLQKRLLFLFPMWACWVALLVPVFKTDLFTPQYQWIMTIVVLVVFVGYMFLIDRFRRQIRPASRSTLPSSWTATGVGLLSVDGTAPLATRPVSTP